MLKEIKELLQGIRNFRFKVVSYCIYFYISYLQCRSTTLKNNHMSNQELQNYPDPKKHKTVSFIKSGIRIVSCFFGSIGYLEYGFFGLAVAEVVGIIEELV